MSTLEVNTITPQSGTTVTIGGSGDTVSLGSGATAGFGKIGQVIWGRTETALTTSSTTYSDLLSLNITPSSTSSKILLMGTVPIRKTDPSPPTDNGAGLRFEKDGTALEEWGRYIAWDNNTQVYIQQTGAMNYLDSPSTTSQINYKLQVRSMVGGSIQACHDLSNASFTLMEILA